MMMAPTSSFSLIIGTPTSEFAPAFCVSVGPVKPAGVSK
jgi:hypothetical protein